MDLKEVIEKVNADAMEAYNAFHAGHKDVAEEHLARVAVLIDDYEPLYPKQHEDVTKSAQGENMGENTVSIPAEQASPGTATSENDASALEKTEFEAPAEPGSKKPVDPAAAARTIGQPPESETPTQ